MARDKGWIKLYRSLMDSAIWNCNEKFDKRSAWIDILLMANHEDREVIINGKLHIIKKGQHWTSYQKLAERWKWSRETVYRFLATLRNSEMITTSATPNGTLISVVKWASYQLSGNTDKTTDEASNTTTNTILDKTTDEAQTRMIKNDIRMSKNKGGASGKVRQ